MVPYFTVFHYIIVSRIRAGFGFDRLWKLVPPRFAIEFSDSFLEDLDALLTTSSRVFVILKIPSTEYDK